jgi:hypothetical protein
MNTPDNEPLSRVIWHAVTWAISSITALIIGEVRFRRVEQNTDAKVSTEKCDTCTESNIEKFNSMNIRFEEFAKDVRETRDDVKEMKGYLRAFVESSKSSGC